MHTSFSCNLKITSKLILLRIITLFVYLICIRSRNYIMLNITRLKVWFILDTLPSNAIIGFRVVILCTNFRLILTSSISIRMQKYAIKKDRLVCSSCNSQIKGAAVKAGGNFWHKVFIMKQGIYFVKNMFGILLLSKKKEQNNSIFNSL